MLCMASARRARQASPATAIAGPKHETLNQTLNQTLSPEPQTLNPKLKPHLEGLQALFGHAVAAPQCCHHLKKGLRVLILGV